MKDLGLGEPIVDEPRHPRPRDPALLTASRERAPPVVGSVIAESGERCAVGWHGMVVEVAGNDLAQPASLFWDRLVHPLPKLFLDLLELRPHAVASSPAVDLELVPPH